MGRLGGQCLELGLGQHDPPAVGLVRLVDVLVPDDLAARLAAALVADPPAVGVMDLMQRDVMRRRGGVQLHRHIDQSEGDRSGPHRPHDSIEPDRCDRRNIQ
ncbi:hypothetical protein SDC9_121834 [bioreactor metagenome]|uniref:Uncharacterized protein n=1 Tax=bioreactor metagenome TaxID=1076179 RepID=A0A645CD45_9ZZZZ